MKTIKLLTALVLLMIFASGCGKKGPLKLPSESSNFKAAKE